MGIIEELRKADVDLMSKQEKIRRESVEICEKSGIGWTEATYLIDFIFTYLDSQDVVLKGDSKLPFVTAATRPLIEKEEK